jgi:hypothetical protein
MGSVNRLGCVLAAAAVLAGGAARAEIPTISGEAASTRPVSDPAASPPALELGSAAEPQTYGLGLVLERGRFFVRQPALATALGAADETLKLHLDDVMVVSEASLMSLSLGRTMGLVERPTPPSLDGARTAADARSADRAWASQTAVSFALVTSTTFAMHRLRPRASTPWLVLGVGGAAATFFAVGRAVGGTQLFTGVVGGSVVGASVGVLLPALHVTPVAVTPLLTGRAPGFALTVRF